MSEQTAHLADTEKDVDDALKPGVAKPKPMRVGKTDTEKLEIFIDEYDQRPGRLDPRGKEPVLRPRERAPSRPDSEGRHITDMKCGELYAAAHRARIARGSIAMLAAAGDHSSAMKAATAVGAAISTHLRAAGHVRNHADPHLLAAFTDAHANITALEEASIDPAAIVVATTLMGERIAIGVPMNWSQPATHKERDRRSDKLARREASSLELVVTARLDHARLALSGAVERYMHALISPSADATAALDDAKRPRYFGPAAQRAALLLAQVSQRLVDARDLVDSRDPQVQQSAHAYASAAQRFVSWALTGPQLLRDEAQQVADASAPLLTWAKLGQLDMTATERAGDAEVQFDNQKQKFEQEWDSIFDKQNKALIDLANAEAPLENPPWASRLFWSLARATLAFVIGGPAGAAGALAEAAVTGGKSEGTKLKTIGGGVANAVESLVTSALGDYLSSAADAVGDASTRKRFFLAQASAVLDVQRNLKQTVHMMLVEEARRSPDGTTYLNDVVKKLHDNAGQVASAQCARSVQDWAIYLATAAHGRDDESGGVDMTGVGGEQALPHPATPALGAGDAETSVPKGVIEVPVVLQDGSVMVRTARATLRADDAKHLQGQRIRDLRMPVRFVIASPGMQPDDQVIVNRNDKGALWLRAAGDGGREHVIARHGGDRGSDADVLRACAMLIASIGDAALATVEGV